MRTFCSGETLLKMEQFCQTLFSFTVLLFSITLCDSSENDFTVDIPAGQTECFYQHINKESSFDFEYQVIEGGEMDIDFVIRAPSGLVLITDIKKQDAEHRLQATEQGDYSFCLDNSFSHFSSKLVFFELATSDPETFSPKSNLYQYVEENVAEVYDMKMEDFKASFDLIKEGLDKSQHVQTRLRSFETRDRSVAESNFERVNWWSAVQLIVMISTSVLQVLMIRSLFDDKSKVAQILKLRT